jgi:hypothetical protein
VEVGEGEQEYLLRLLTNQEMLPVQLDHMIHIDIL